jgi:hypothetical protein
VRQDFDFVLRCLENAAAVPGTGTATFYRRHDASATRSAFAVRDAQRTTRLVLKGFFARHPELVGTEIWRDAWANVHEAEARTALYQGRLVATLWLALPLLRVAPRKVAGLYLRVASSAARISGAAIARTTAPALGRLRRTARSP